MFTFKLFEFSRQKATYGKCDKNVTNVTKCDKCDILAIFGAKIQMYEDEKYYFWHENSNGIFWVTFKQLQFPQNWSQFLVIGCCII